MCSLKVCALWLVVTVCASATGQWRALGPFGGAAEAIVKDPADPDRLLAATRNGLIYRSGDNGASWTAVAFPNELSTTIYALIVTPQTPPVYYAGTASGLYKSRNAGDTWEPLEGMTGADVFALAAWKSDPNVIAAGRRDGVYLSRDAGASWKRISAAQNRELQPVMAVAIDPLDSQVIYAGTTHLPWKTSDGGATWQSIHRGMLDDSDVFSIEVDPTNPHRIFASTCSGIYNSIDQGRSWVRLVGIPHTSRRTYTIRLDPANGRIVYAGTSRGLWRSADGGTTWKQISPLVVKSIAFDPRNTKRLYMASQDAGILVSDDEAETIRPANAGFVERRLSAMETALDSLLLASIYERGHGLYRFSPAADRWEKLSGPTHTGTGNILAMAAVDAHTLLAATYDAIWKSTDGARTWSLAAQPGRARVQSLKALSGPPHVILAATTAGLFRSEDLGESWRLTLSMDVSADALYVSSGRGGPVLARTAEEMFLSDDRGATWLKVNMPVAGVGLYGIAVSGDGVLLAGTAQGLYRSADSARSWQLVDGPLGTGTVRSVFFHPVWPLVFAVQHGNVYISRDRGVKWSLLAQEPARYAVQALSVLPGTPHLLYALTRARGVFVYSLSRPEGNPATRITSLDGSTYVQ